MVCVSNISPIFIGIFIIDINLRLTFQVCPPLSRPEGAKDCLYFPQYTESQVATCQSDKEVRKISGGRHACPGISYCYYQCMLSDYGTDRGSVAANCRCPTPVTATNWTAIQLQVIQMQK